MSPLPTSVRALIVGMLDGLRRRSRAWKHKTHSVQCERVFEEADGKRTERLDLTLQQSRSAKALFFGRRFGKNDGRGLMLGAGGKKEMIRALASAALLCACATAPSDPWAYPEPQQQITASPLPPLENLEPALVVSDLPITAMCRDRWISHSPRRSGTCSGHGGVRKWVNRPAH